MNTRSITFALRGRWQGSHGLCRCPAHADRTPSLKVRDDPRKDDGVDVHCFAGCDWRAVKAALVGQRLLPLFDPRAPQRLRLPVVEADGDEAARVDLALKIWNAAGPLGDSLGFRYLTERRGLHVGLLELDHCLRFHEGFNAVVALMTDPVTNQPTGVHRTFLNADGTKRDKRMLGGWGAVRLTPDEDVLEGLGICEGIEDGLSILLGGWAPVWVATSCGAIERFPVLSGVECLTIFHDADDAGRRAAETCAARWAEAGREVRLSLVKDTFP